jgi:Lipocalin-like domain
MRRDAMFAVTTMSLVSLVLVLAATDAVAQQKSIKDQLVGTWTVVSWDQVRADGSNVQRFGGNPKGINVFDANGRFFVMFARPDLPKIASRDPLKTTTEENKAVMEGTIAYYGTYSVSESDKVLTLRVEASSFPNQVGADQKRTITELTGDQLKYENTTVLSGGQIHVVLSRLK